MNTSTKRVAASGGGSGGGGDDSGDSGGVIRDRSSTTVVEVASGGHFNGGGSGGRVRTCWSLDGPVDSFFFIFSLRVGVGLLATNDLFNGMVAVLYLNTFYCTHLQTILAAMRSQYLSGCSGLASVTTDCENLREAMEQTEAYVDVYLNLPNSVYVQGFFCVVAGAVGLWAIFLRSKQAVRLYMLSWPAKLALGVLSALNMRSLQIKYDVARGPTAAIAWLLNLVFNVYFFKVSWSYYKLRVLNEDDARIHTTSSSSNAAYGEQPFVA